MTFEMDIEIEAAWFRVTFVLGGQKHTHWADSVHVDPEGDLAFHDVETGHNRYVSSTVEFVVTGVDELPPAVRETMEERER